MIFPVANENKAHPNMIYEYLSDFCVGVFNACENLKIEVVIKYLDIHSVNTEKSIRSILAYIKKNPVKGIMTVSVIDQIFFQSLYHTGLPCLVVDHWPLGLNLPSFNPDHSAATKELVFVLASLKHKNIALIDRINSGSNPELVSGYKAGLQATQLKFQENLIFNVTTGLFSRQEFLSKFEKLLTSNDRPTAFITYHSGIAIELVKVLRRVGLKIPRDVSIVSFCSSKIVINDLILSGIFYDWVRIGSQSVSKLLNLTEQKTSIVYGECFHFSFWHGNTISSHRFRPMDTKAP
jgi:DNA-binding LacI/PurR family transcriptional regulator